MEYPVPVGISIIQPLYVRIKNNSENGGGYYYKSQRTMGSESSRLEKYATSMNSH